MTDNNVSIVKEYLNESSKLRDSVHNLDKIQELHGRALYILHSDLSLLKSKNSITDAEAKNLSTLECMKNLIEADVKKLYKMKSSTFSDQKNITSARQMNVPSYSALPVQQKYEPTNTDANYTEISIQFETSANDQAMSDLNTLSAKNHGLTSIADNTSLAEKYKKIADNQTPMNQTGGDNIIISIKDKNFDAFQNGLDVNKPTIVNFWAKWCPHSTNFKPQWDKFASNSKIQAVDVEVSADHPNKEKLNESMKRINVTGYPSVILFYNGRKINYSGDRTEQSLKSFVQSNVG